jgi:hypothetical protein
MLVFNSNVDDKIVTARKLKQEAKALFFILVTVAGIITDSNE